MENQYKILVSPNGNENSFKELTKTYLDQIKKALHLILITYLINTKLKIM